VPHRLARPGNFVGGGPLAYAWFVAPAPDLSGVGCVVIRYSELVGDSVAAKTKLVPQN
jgi:hypothetical protein